MRKIWFCLVKDKVSSCERYGFALWKIRFCKMKDMVSSTGKYHFGLPKKQEIGLSYTDFVNYLCNKRLQKYNPYWNLHWNPHWTRTGTLTEKYCFGIPADWLWFHKIQVMMTRMKWTTCMVWWLSLRFHYKDTTKKRHFQIFENICHQSSDKVMWHWNRGALWSIRTGCSDSLVEEIPTTIVVNYVPHERIFVNAAFSVDKT